MHAAHNGHVQVIKRLLEAGADIEAKDQSGYTPLMVAICTDRFSAADALIKAKADVGVGWGVGRGCGAGVKGAGSVSGAHRCCG